MQTVSRPESLKAVKDMVTKELPDFNWGYNGGGIEEAKNTPLFFAEECKGNGWMLDEAAYEYNAKTSPYHYWNAYAKRMVEFGDHVRQLGGIYNPYPFGRGFDENSQSEADFSLRDDFPAPCRRPGRNSFIQK